MLTRSQMDYYQPRNYDIQFNRNDLAQFAQLMGEPLWEAWDRYKEMLRRCPYHGMPDWMEIDCFYNGLGGQSRHMVDAASGGALWEKSYDVAYELIETLAANEYHYPTQWINQPRAAGGTEEDVSTALASQLEALSRQIDSLRPSGVPQVAIVCELCAGNHDTHNCFISTESFQYMNNYQGPQQPDPNEYHPGNGNLPDFSWINNQQENQHQFIHSQQQDDWLDNQQSNQQQYNENYNPQTSAYSEMDELRLMMKSQADSFKNMENHIEQLMNAVLHRPPSVMPSDMEANPSQVVEKEHVEVTTGDSGNENRQIEADQGWEESSQEEEEQQKDMLEASQPVEQPAENSKEHPKEQAGQTPTMDELLKSEFLQEKVDMEEEEGANYDPQQFNIGRVHKQVYIPDVSLGLADLWKSQVRLKEGYEEAPTFEIKLVDSPRYEHSNDSYSLPVITTPNLADNEEEQWLRSLIVSRGTNGGTNSNDEENNLPYGDGKILLNGYPPP